MHKKYKQTQTNNKMIRIMKLSPDNREEIHFGVRAKAQKLVG
jgi:hypothetical protein